MMTKTLILSTAGALLMLSSAAQAQSTVSATTDLNIRSGPGSQYKVVGQIAAGETATLQGCAENSKWCAVSIEGGQGWVYSDYLTGEFGGSQVVLSERPADAVPVTTYDDGGSDDGLVVGATTGAIAGALIGGPVGAAAGAVVGAAAGGTAGSVIDPPEQVRTYVSSNTVDPVYLEGEVVVGAGLPETVEIREIPDYEYRYVNVNGQPVLVDPASRRIVYVFR